MAVFCKNSRTFVLIVKIYILNAGGATLFFKQLRCVR